MSDRALTPLKNTTNVLFTTTTSLNKKEFPRFDNNGNLLCPPAPPRIPYEIRVCLCNQTYQIKLKTDSNTKCGKCSNI